MPSPLPCGWRTTPPMPNDPSRSRGAALALVLVLFPLILILGLAFLTLAGADYGFSSVAAARVRTLYLAESGFHFAYEHRGRWRADHDQLLELSTGQVRVRTHRGADQKVLIRSTGRSGRTVYDIVALVHPNGKVLSWEETEGVWEESPSPSPSIAGAPR